MPKSTADIDPLVVNARLAELLHEAADFYAMSKDAKDRYRAKAFNTAAGTVADHPAPITSGSEAMQLAGIGPSIGGFIDEYLTTGQVQRLEELRRQHPGVETIDKFKAIHGISASKALALYNKGHRTLEDIQTENLTEAQRVGILYSAHFQQRIPRVEMDQINATIGSLLNPYGIKWEVTGSYRRQEPSSSDVDIVVESRADLNMDGLIYLLRSIVPENGKLAKGDTKYMGVVRLSEQYNGHRIDIRLVMPEAYPTAVIYFTGSQRFNILLRSRANELGLKLNEYGIFDSAGNHLSNIRTEADIFAALRIQYLAPVDRTRTISNLTRV